MGMERGLDLDPVSFRLDRSELLRLASVCAIALPDTADEAELCRPHSIESVPYLVHTGYELPLMLEGRKPFAFFCSEGENAWFEDLQRTFAPHVASGRFHRDVLELTQMCPTTNGGQKEMRAIYVTYALNGEEWRFERFKRERLALHHHWRPWTEADEREEGLLLGYSEEQCDWWIANRFGKRHAQ
ncbi:hypothetical protein [Ensifer sp. 4252]|uniref:hypothetical protein n=1 Tax=Ensifer sp. 4252 TaxID=3373915 RepID=UPI003D20FBF0